MALPRGVDVSVVDLFCAFCRATFERLLQSVEDPRLSRRFFKFASRKKAGYDLG